MLAVILATACLASSQALAAAPMDAKAKERARLEELFIWKTSEELKLAPATEQKYNETIKALNVRRREANAKMDAALSALAKAKSKAEAEKALAEHKAALRDVQSTQTAEIDKLRPLLGPEKLAQYIVVKSSILEKLKSMLAAPAPAPATAPASAPTEQPAPDTNEIPAPAVAASPTKKK